MLIPDFAAHVAVPDFVPAKCGFTVAAWALPPETAARHARRLLRSQVTPHIQDQAVLEDLDLMVSELGTNAAVHADGPYEMRIVHHRDVPVVCEIADSGGGLDTIAENLRRRVGPAEILGIDELRVGGRGLGVVAILSAGRCGVHTTRLCDTGQPGKSVWFAIPADCSAAADAALRLADEDARPKPHGLRKAVAEMFLDVKSGVELRVTGRY